MWRGIYGIVDADAGGPPLDFARILLDAGIRTVQYRAKRGVDPHVVRALVAEVRRVGARLIVNDDLEAALLADGWHAGQADLKGHEVATVRRRLGARLFGISVGTPDEARSAEACGADYLGVGPYALTATKPDTRLPLGEAGLRAVVAATRLPVVAIGGITIHDLPSIAATGTAMAAVISAVAAAGDRAAAARSLVAAWPGR